MSTSPALREYPLLLTAKDAARRAGISRKHLYELLGAGLFVQPVVVWGRQLPMFRDEDVLGWVRGLPTVDKDAQ